MKRNNHLQIAFITGRSDPNNCLLSPIQSAFIQRLAAPGRRLVMHNFPYVDNGQTVYRIQSLPKASYYNAREYLNSRQNGFAARYHSSVYSLLEQAVHTVFLAGSCGLELFNNLKLPTDLLSNVSVFAYGPVARIRPNVQHQLVQGQRDFISKLWFRQADIYVAGGHLDYLSHPEVFAHCEAFIRLVESGNQSIC